MPTLEEIFRPDQYGFCHAPLDDKKNAVWFDTVHKVISTLKDAGYDMGTYDSEL